ncbi:MAG: TerB family tellurite resistance protein [Candidatus Pelagibacter sp.]|nr:TerB family tellurite resistance protein [Candidatus Pelagibacter sp.]
MSIWGSLIGGLVGFTFAGPIRALIGSMVGGRISSARRSGSQQNFPPPQQIFAIALIILTAKLAKADGHVSKKELIAIKNKLKIPEHEMDQVGEIFNKAKEDSLGYEPYAQQIGQIYKNNPVVLVEVINTLFYIAEADFEVGFSISNVSDSEITMIRDIAKIFGLSESQFEGIKESRKSSDKLNPYIVLGCSSNDDFVTIRKKYLQLSKEHHPDILMNKGVPIEVIEESKKKMRAINSAFDQIKKMNQK